MKLLLTVLSPFLAPLHLYMTQLFVHLSVIRQSNHHQQSKPTSTTNRTYLATFFAFSIAVLYGTLGLHLEAGQPLTLNSLLSSPYLLWRQFYLQSFWLSVDIIWSIALSCTLFAVLDFALKDSIAEKYLFKKENERLKLDGKEISPTESSQLLSMFRRFRILYRLFFLTIYICSIQYIYWMLFFVIKMYLTTFFSLTFWFIVFHYFFSVFVLFVFVNIIHIIIASSCIQIRQQHLLGQFAQVLRNLLQKRPSRPRLHRIWPHYLTLNRSVLSICLQLEAFNRFYSNYLTAIFLEYTVVQVMLAYIIFFASIDLAIIILLKSLLVFVIFEMATLLFGLIQFCARVVKKNSRITKLNRQFAVHCLRNQQIYRLSIRELLKIELLQWPRLLHFYAFKLFGGSRITSKTFYAMAINIIVFFLFVMKRIR